MTDHRDGQQSEAGMAGVAGRGAAPVPRHVAFRPGFVWLALAAAVFGGFGLAAHLSVVIGFGYRLGPAFPALAQAHGHAQLVGWAGLFVVGVSLHFIPRLATVITDLIPAVDRLTQRAFGLSGLLALTSVILLSVNLLWTMRLRG